jgi:hypothetical protein
MAAGEARHEKETKEKEAAFGRILKNHILLEKRKWSKENQNGAVTFSLLGRPEPRWAGEIKKARQRKQVPAALRAAGENLSDG